MGGKTLVHKPVNQYGVALEDILGPRLMLVAEMTVEGKSRQEIADALGISPKAASACVQKVYEKLQITDCGVDVPKGSPGYKGKLIEMWNGGADRDEDFFPSP